MAEAVRLANDEGLKPERANNASGYKGVQYHKDLKSKPFEAQISQGGEKQSLGYFATAEEAALAYARADNNNKIAAGKPSQAFGSRGAEGGGGAACE